MDQTMSDRLRLARENAGFNSARSAALAIGVNPSTYGAHENGQNNYKPKDAEYYAKAFRVSSAWLMTGIPLIDEDLNAQYGIDRPINIDLVRDVPAAHDDLVEKGVPPLGAASGRTFADGPRGHKIADGVRGQKIAEIDLVAGMGGGGLATTEVSTNNGITFHSEVVRAHWEMPPWVLSKMNVRAQNVACFPCQGDSMTPTISDGDVIFIDTRHRVPSPPGIYAIADEFGGVVVKRLEVVSKPREEDVKVRVSSDNPHYRDKELLLNEITILGRYICRVAF